MSSSTWRSSSIAPTCPRNATTPRLPSPLREAGQHPEKRERGRSPVLTVTDGAPVLRLRLINAGPDTPYRVAVSGLQLTVTHTDGFPMVPVTVDTVLLGMGGRYDVTVPAAGSFPLVGDLEGKDGQARPVMRAHHAGSLPDWSVRPDDLDGQLLALEDLPADARVALRSAEPDRTYRLALTGDMVAYEWTVERADEA